MTIERIMLPTDGSPLSERAIFLAERVAHAHDASVVAVRVVESLGWIGEDVSEYLTQDRYDALLSLLEQEAGRELSYVTRYLRAQGLRATSALLSGHPAHVLLDYIAENQPDLIVMSSHGRSGLLRFAFGSIADRLVRDSTIPLLSVRAQGTALSPLERALVPLDGSALSEAALPMVETLATRPIQAVRLLRVVDDRAQVAEAERYLDTVATRLDRLGIKIETSVEYGDARDQVLVAARDVDLLIMSTHGRTGLDYLRNGSVAEHISTRAQAPCLLVRPVPALVMEVPSQAAAVARA